MVSDDCERDYLERYVNDGSPSGFSVQGQMSKETDPFGDNAHFSPYRVYHKEGLALELHRSSYLRSLPLTNDFVIHPDMREQWETLGCEVEKAEDIVVVPTSSGRTVRVCDKNRPYFLKFDYAKTLGRVNRAITRIKAIAGIEMNDELTAAAAEFPQGLVSLLPEYAALIARPCNNNSVEWKGLVYRDGYPIIFNSRTPDRLIPLFSFWSTDRRTGKQEYVFRNMFCSNIDKFANALKMTASALVDFYFFLLSNFGLQMEFNAQNILVGIDRNADFCSVVLRDFNSTEKDFPLRRSRDLPLCFVSFPYKCLLEIDNYYFIRHSFAFDFKLSEYVVRPALMCAEMKLPGTFTECIRNIRSTVRQWITRLPYQVFPPNHKWYRHPKVELTKERPYEEVDSPLLREER